MDFNKAKLEEYIKEIGEEAEDLYQKNHMYENQLQILK